MMPVMRTIVFFLLALFALPLALVPADAAPDRDERKEAAVWVKEETTRLKKTLALLKKVKDEKSATKVGKALLELYGASGESTAMGETGPGEKPTGEAFTEAEKKNAKALLKLNKGIAAQRERIEKLDLESPKLSEALSAVDEAPSVGSVDDEEDDAFEDD